MFIFYQVRGIIQHVFHIKDVYMYSKRENNIWIYKNDPLKSLHTLNYIRLINTYFIKVSTK